MLNLHVLTPKYISKLRANVLNYYFVNAYIYTSTLYLRMDDYIFHKAEFSVRTVD